MTCGQTNRRTVSRGTPHADKLQQHVTYQSPSSDICARRRATAADVQSSASSRRHKTHQFRRSDCECDKRCRRVNNAVNHYVYTAFRVGARVGILRGLGLVGSGPLSKILLNCIYISDRSSSLFLTAYLVFGL